jgi:hypothetical protein
VLFLFQLHLVLNRYLSIFLLIHPFTAYKFTSPLFVSKHFNTPIHLTSLSTKHNTNHSSSDLLRVPYIFYIPLFIMIISFLLFLAQTSRYSSTPLLLSHFTSIAQNPLGWYPLINFAFRCHNTYP